MQKNTYANVNIWGTIPVGKTAKKQFERVRFC